MTSLQTLEQEVDKDDYMGGDSALMDTVLPKPGSLGLKPQRGR
jgi:hypothetical protein